jgi:hypothetical protein
MQDYCYLLFSVYSGSLVLVKPYKKSVQFDFYDNLEILGFWEKLKKITYLKTSDKNPWVQSKFANNCSIVLLARTV